MKRAFVYAFYGILDTARKERSFRIMLVCLAAVIAAGFICELSGFEWAAVLICCGGTLALELVNTAIEAVVDLMTQERHELAKVAKDTAAGATFVFSIFSAAVGLVIFIPRVLEMIRVQ